MVDLLNNGVSYNDWMTKRLNFQKQETAKQNAINDSKREQEANELFSCSLTSTNGKAIKQYTSASRMKDLADGMRKWREEKFGKRISEGVNDNDIICTYINSKPESRDSIINYLNGKSDIVGISEELGFSTPTIDTGDSEENGEPSTLRNIAQGIYDSAAGLTYLTDKYVATPIAAGIAKMMPGTDNEKIDQAKEETLQDIDNMKYTDIGGDRDAISYEISNLASDLAQVVTPTPAGKLNLLSKYPKIAKLLQTEKGAKLVTELSKEYPKLTKFFSSVGKGGVEGVKDTVKFNAVNAEGTNLEEAVEGAAVGGVLGAGGQVLGNTLDKAKHFLATNGLMNPSGAKKVMKQLIADGFDTPGKGTIEDFSQWLLERDINGNKTTILEKLEEHGEKSKAMVDKLLSSSKTTHNLPEADEALEALIKRLDDKPGMGEEVKKLQDLYSKKGQYSLADLNATKRELDDIINMYTSTGDPSAAETAKGYRNLRKAIKEKIEKEADIENLGNIRMLNNETQVAHSMYDGIKAKKTTEDISDTIYNNFGLGMAGLGGAVGFLKEGDMEGALKYGLAGMLMKNTAVKTKLAKAINKMQGNEKVEITKWLGENGKKALSKKANDKLAEVIKKDSSIMDTIKSTLSDMMVSGTRIGGQKGVEEMVGE